MVIITVELKAKMAGGDRVIYSMAAIAPANTETARCRALTAAHAMAARQGVRVQECRHSFKVN